MLKTGSFLLLLAFILLLAWLVPPLFGPTGIPGYLPLHALFETVSIVVAMLVFAVGWNSRSRNLPGNVVLLACVFFAIGWLDFSHTLAYKGMPDFYTANDAQKQLNFWLSARFLASFILLVVAIRSWDPLRSKATRFVLMGVLVSIVVFINWLVLFHQDWLPDTFIPGQGLTPLKKNLEYLFIAFNLTTAAILLMKMRTKQSFNVLNLFAAVCVMAMSEFFFTLYTTMTGGYNVWGHVYKVVSYFFIYRAIVVEAIDLPYSKLEKAQLNLSTALRASNIGLWDWDLRSNEVKYSAEWKAQLGYTDTELDNHFSTWESLLHPDEKEIAIKHVQDFVASTESMYSNEYRLRHRNGSYRTILTQGEKLFNFQGKAIRMVGSHVDITERMQAANQFRSVVEASPNAIIMVDEHGIVVLVNSETSTLFGYAREELIGKHINLLLPVESRPAHETQVSKYIEQSSVRRKLGEGRELYGQARDGRKIPVEVGLSPVQNGEGSFVIATVIDITERKRAEKSLRESERKLESMFQTIVEGVLTVDLTGQITFANQSALNILNVSQDAITKKYFQSTEWRQIDEQYNPYPQEQLPLAIVLHEKRSVENIQHGIIAVDGQLKWLSVNAAPLFDAEGNLTGAIASFRNFTEIKKREAEAIQLREQITQATKMESVGHLTAGIAHDFNNILGAMMGYTELTQHMLATGNTAVIAGYQEQILTAGNRAKELIAQMLTFSRISPELSSAQAPVTQLTTIVKEVVALLRSSIPRTIELNYRIDDENLNARIQPVHLHQILLNLGVNARDALGEYGKIDITLSKRNFDHMLCSSCNTLYTGDFAQITVKDSGSGIPTHILKKIFDPFFTTKGVGKGTGMGLSVVHGLVHAQGGHIVVETGAEGGTSISILLPLAAAKEVNDETVVATTEINVKDLRIMVVDDEPALSSMLYELFTAQGAQAVAFTSPGKALEAFMQNPDSIDMVVTDETMPGISGMLLAEKMLKIKPGLPIILCTGYSDHANAESAAKIGIAGFFHKPLNMLELLQKIQELRGARV